MTTLSDGRSRCDRCGADVGNAGIDKCVVISGLVDTGGTVVNLHLCTFTGRLDGVDGRTSPEAEKCAARVLTRKALAFYVDKVGEPGEMVRLYDVTADPARDGA